MKLHHLRNVVAVVERGSLRAGARHLGLAQPAVSRSIKELEQELGLVLFERNKFGMTLTRAGEVFVRRAKGIQAELARTLVNTDPHSPGKYRVNGVVQNMPEFQQAWGCKTGQAMVRENACRVW